MVNPATGEQIKTYPTITDDELQAAITKAYETHEGWSRSTSVAERAALISHVAELHVERKGCTLPRSSLTRWASRSGDAVGEIEFSAAIYQFLRRQCRGVPRWKTSRSR